jgi:hypothetical protein
VPHYLSIDMRGDKMASTLVFVFSFALLVYPANFPFTI